MHIKIGLEIHQQIDTGKLFCSCPTKLVDTGEFKIKRRLRVTESESGGVDRAALFEYEKRREYLYACSDESSCLVELDEEPPHGLNGEALEISLGIAKMFGAEVFDVICFMRKIVIDGSNTSGFQRTALMASGGRVDGTGIASICLEEDSARKVRGEGNTIHYNLDRLGAPLIEIATDPTIESPEEAQRVAYTIGTNLRRARVKRGLGSIRQDLNISMDGFPKVEIKGIQRLGDIVDVLDKEVKRQRNMIEVKIELDKRLSADPALRRKSELSDLTELFKNTESRLVSIGMGEGKGVFGIPLRGFRGLISKGGEFRVAREFVAYSGLKGILHGDELPAYGIREVETDRIREAMNLDDVDSFVLVVEDREEAKKALGKIYDRVFMCFDGVVGEVRRASGGGHTEYMRPMPGSERMYPETDISYIVIDREHLESLELPETLETKKKRFGDLGANEQQCDELFKNGYEYYFETLAREFGEPQVVLKMLNNTLVELERVGNSVSKIDIRDLRDVLGEYKKGVFGKEAIDGIIRVMCGEGLRAIGAIERLGLDDVVTTEEAGRFIEGLIRDNRAMIRDKGERAFKPLMGQVMKRYRGSVDGSILGRILEEKMRGAINED